MELLQQLPAGAAPSVVAIGVFDGVHRGHRRLLQTAQQLAKRHGLRSLVYTFDPHPVNVLRGPGSVTLIEPVPRRLEHLESLGFAACWVAPFTRDFAATSPDHFIDGILVDALGARHVVVGEGFTFGRRQLGTTATLQQAAALQTHVVPLERDARGVVCSSRIRQSIVSGDLQDATACLGREFSIKSHVLHGAGRGKKLGFGTANLALGEHVVVPRGVYACRATGSFGERLAVTNVGVAPTFGEVALPRVEVHLLDYSGEPLYGTTLEVAFCCQLRGEQKFSSVDALVTQIRRDAAAARQALRSSPST